MSDIPLIDKQRASQAFTQVESYLEWNAWPLIRRFDTSRALNSGIGERPRVYRRDLPDTKDHTLKSQHEAIADAAGNALSAIVSVTYIFRYPNSPQGEGLIKYLAEQRQELTQPHLEETITANHPQKLMLRQVAFDEFVKALGGEGVSGREIGKKLLDSVVEYGKQPGETRKTALAVLLENNNTPDNASYLDR